MQKDQTYYIDKSTMSPADNLLTFGLAQLLAYLMNDESDNILQINDVGDSFQIELRYPLTEEQISCAGFKVLFHGLDTAKKQAKLSQSYRVDYVRHQQSNQAYFDARKKEKDESKLQDQGFRPPVPEWSAWAVINQMSATDTYNGLAEMWYAHRGCFPELLHIILATYRVRPNALEQAEEDWRKLAKVLNIPVTPTAPQLQVVNPGMGKGGNRSKSDGLGIGGLKGFWIPEYLKFAGLFQAGIPRTVSNRKDRKTYILRPKELHWDTHRKVFPDFQSSLYANSAVKMDILAVFRYCEVFLKQWKSGQGNGWARFARGKPGDHVAALDVIFYKYLGSAYATMNLSTLVLPEWLDVVETTKQADLYLSMLNEHQQVIRNLDEKIGDEYEILRRYRDFLSARDLHAFFQFTRGYSSYLMRKLRAGGYPPRQFTIPHLEVLIMAHDIKLTPILQNQGFLNIAKAIRRSTVNLQYQKSRGRDQFYEIRYGLGDQLIRHAQYKEEFIQDLSRFAHDYNRENARKSETRKKQFRSNITTDDLAEIVQLIDQFGSPTIANLLVAYGYAREPHPEEGEEAETEVEPEAETDLELEDESEE